MAVVLLLMEISFTVFVGAAGEIGHIVVEPHDGFACTCGNHGCLETVTSATGVVRLARKFAEEYEGSSQIKASIDNGDEVTSKDIFIAAEAGDAFALSVVDKFAYYLGFACANLGSTLNPAAIVIGGGVSAAGDFSALKLKLISKNIRSHQYVTLQKSNLLSSVMMLVSSVPQPSLKFK